MSDLSPLVSVIIPIYNSEEFLEQCLDSIRAQTFTDIEIICVDDGSTDGSPQILREYRQLDDRIRVITQENMSCGAARNTGLRAAGAGYVLFIDSDDFVEKNMVRDLYEEAVAGDCDIVVCNAWKYDNRTGTEYEVGYIREDLIDPGKIISWRDYPEYIFNVCNPAAWNKIYRKSFLVDNGLEFEEVRRSEDLYFFCAAFASAERIGFVRRPLYHYRVGLTGNLQSAFGANILCEYESLKQVRRRLREMGLYEELDVAFKRKASQILYYVYEHISEKDKVLLLDTIKNDTEPLFLTGLKEQSIKMRGPYWKLCEAIRNSENREKR